MPSLSVLEFEQQISELDSNIIKIREAAEREGRDVSAEIDDLERNRDGLLRDFFDALTPWDNVLLARHTARPYTLDYIPHLFEDFLELKGDRLHGDDGAMVGGFALFEGKPVMVIGQQKGRDLKERTLRNYGYSRPEGYRKALRLMQMAAKFGHPVITLVDTPGADANVASEERGISEAIARNLREMAVLRTPIVSVIIGEGGSGGALGIAVADRVLMLQHSVYSVIAPEGCASIIWRDPNRKAEAARAMRMTARETLEQGLVDAVLPEPLGGAHRSLETTAATIKQALSSHLKEISRLSRTRLLAARYDKLRSFGRFDEVAPLPPPGEAEAMAGGTGPTV